MKSHKNLKFYVQIQINYKRKPLNGSKMTAILVLKSP